MPVAKSTEPAGRSNRLPDRFAVNSASSLWLRSRTTGLIHASISGVIVPGPPKTLSGTQPATAAQAAGSLSARAMLRML